MRTLSRAATTAVAILALIVAGSANPAHAEDAPSDDAAMWIEAESGSLTGGYVQKSDTRASAASYVRVDSTTVGAQGTASYALTAEEATSYDIWVLGTPANVNWASAYEWRVDAASYAAAQVVAQQEPEYRTNDSRNVPLRWQNLGALDLSAGSHQLDIRTSVPRTLDGTLTIQYLDTIVLVPRDWSWSPDGFTPPGDPGDRWLEAERATSVTGGLQSKVLSNASSGRALVLDSTTLPSGGAAATVGFSIPEAGGYDVWILSTSGSDNWASNYRWALDSAASQSFAPQKTSDIVYRTADSRQVPLRWYKLTSSPFTVGSHELHLSVPSVRTLDPANPLAIAYFDTIAVVPTGWNIAMQGMVRPFNPSLLDLDFVAGTLSESELDRGDPLSVTVTASLAQSFAGRVLFKVDLISAGKSVATATSAPERLTGRAVNQDFTVGLNLTIPFDAPRGDLEVAVSVVNAEFSQGQTVSAGSVLIGAEAAEASPFTLSQAEADLPQTVSAGAEVSVDTTFSLDQEVSFDSRPYAAFYADGLLRGVAESDSELQTSTWTPEQPQSESVTFAIPNELAAGEYEVFVGLHGLEMSSSSAGTVDVSQSESGDWKPLSNGALIDAEGSSHFWYVTQNGAMIWDGQPYIPVGAMWVSRYIREYDPRDPAKNQANWNYDLGVLQLMADEGVKDLYVQAVVGAGGAAVPPWAWQFMMESLEDFGFIYGLQINGYQSPVIEGDLLRVGAEQREFTVDGFGGQGTVTKDLDLSADYPTVRDVTAVRFAVVDATTGSVVSVGDAQADPLGARVWRASVELSLPAGTYSVRFTPRIVAPSAALQNFWDDPETGRSALVSLVDSLKFGPGFRFFVDPARNEANIVNYDESVRVRSDAFDSQFATWLEGEFDSLSALASRWKLNAEPADFEAAARLVPVNTNSRDEPRPGELTLIDPETSALTTADGVQGTLWDDFLRFRSDAYRSFNNETADAIKAKADAPVVYKYTGALKAFFTQTDSSGGFDGLGGEIYGDEEHILREKLGYSYSAAQASSKTLWLLTTETQLDEDTTRKAASGEVGYPSETVMHSHFDTLLAGGEKGIFDFLFDAYHDSRLRDFYSYTAKPVQFDWLRNYRDELLSPSSVDDLLESQPIDIYYMYPGAQTWWINPNERAAVLPDDDYDSYGVMRTGDDKYVVSTFDPSVAKGGVLVVNLEDAPATTVWGAALEEQIGALLDQGTRIVITGMRKDLGSLPSIDSYFSEELITLAGGAAAQVLVPTVTSEILQADGDDVWALRDGNLWIIANDEWRNGDQIYFIDTLELDEPATPTPDTTRPTVSLLSPSAATQSDRNVVVSVSANDDRSLQRIVGNIYRDGSLFKSTQSAVAGRKSASYEATVSLPPGQYVLKYNARDRAGNTSKTYTSAFIVTG